MEFRKRTRDDMDLVWHRKVDYNEDSSSVSGFPESVREQQRSQRTGNGKNNHGETTTPTHWKAHSNEVYLIMNEYLSTVRIASAKKTKMRKAILEIIMNGKTLVSVKQNYEAIFSTLVTHFHKIHSRLAEVLGESPPLPSHSHDSNPPQNENSSISESHDLPVLITTSQDESVSAALRPILKSAPKFKPCLLENRNVSWGFANVYLLEKKIKTGSNSKAKKKEEHSENGQESILSDESEMNEQVDHDLNEPMKKKRCATLETVNSPESDNDNETAPIMVRPSINDEIAIVSNFNEKCYENFKAKSATVNSENREQKCEKAIQSNIKVEIEETMPVFDLEYFSNPTQTSDFVVSVEQQQLHLNKGLLSVYSDYFLHLFTHSTITEPFEIINVSLKDFLAILCFIYPSDGRPEINVSNAVNLLKLSARFQMKFLTRKCEKFLNAILKQHTSEANAEANQSSEL